MQLIARTESRLLRHKPLKRVFVKAVQDVEVYVLRSGTGKFKYELAYFQHKVLESSKWRKSLKKTVKKGIKKAKNYYE